jgi:hypothetical protein
MASSIIRRVISSRRRSMSRLDLRKCSEVCAHASAPRVDRLQLGAEQSVEERHRAIVARARAPRR